MEKHLLFSPVILPQVFSRPQNKFNIIMPELIRIHILDEKNGSKQTVQAITMAQWLYSPDIIYRIINCWQAMYTSADNEL